MPKRPILKQRILELLKDAESGLTSADIVAKLSVNSGTVSRDLRDLMKDEWVICQVHSDGSTKRLRRVFIYKPNEKVVFCETRYLILRCFLHVQPEPTNYDPETEQFGKYRERAPSTVMQFSRIRYALRKRYSTRIGLFALEPIVSELVKNGYLRAVRPSGLARRPYTRMSKSNKYLPAAVVRVPSRIRHESYQLTTRGFETALVSAVKTNEKLKWAWLAELYKENFPIFKSWKKIVLHGRQAQMVERIEALFDNPSNFARYEPVEMNFQMNSGVPAPELLFPSPWWAYEYGWHGNTFDDPSMTPSLNDWLSMLREDRMMRSDGRKATWLRYKMYSRLARNWRKAYQKLTTD